MESFFRSAIRRYFDVEFPAGHARRKGWPLLLALHGYQGNKDSMLAVARQIAAGNMVVISLQGPYQFILHFGTDTKKFQVGFGWGTMYKMQDSIQLHHHDVETIIARALRDFRIDSRQIFLLAFSQACALNYRYVFTHPHVIRGAIGVCGGTPGDWGENRRYQPASTHVFHIAARHDVWYTRERNLEIRRQLAERAASLDFRFYNSSHKFPRSSIPHIRRWISKYL